MASKTYYYARVSSSDQNLARQVEAFKALGADDRDIFTDKKSGKDTEREGYQAVKYNLREGDTLVIKSLDRLSRNKTDIAAELQYFRAHGIRVKVMDIPTTMIDYPEGQGWVIEMVNNIIIEVLSTIAQQERENIKTRQAEGNAQMTIGDDGKRHSLKTGKAVGRPAIQFPANWNEVYPRWKAGEIKAVEAMQMTNTKKASFYKLVKMFEDKATA